MKKKILKTLLLVCCCIGIGGPAWALDPEVGRLEKTTFPNLEIPNITKKKMKSGMRLFLLEDDEVPVVRGFFYIRTGSIYEPANKTGLAALTGQLLRSGGTRSLSPEKLNEKLAGMGAEISTGINREYGFLSFKCLKEDLPEVLRLVFDILREPAFNQEKLQLIKLQMLESLRRQNDNPMEIAMREFPKLVYGKENIWSRTPTMQSIKSLTKEDVERFYHRFYYPNRMILALAGDFEQQEFLTLMNKNSEGWNKAPQPLPKRDLLKKQWDTGVFLVNKKTDQTTVLLGHYGERRFNPDKFALLLLNDILGGDVMSSRLGKRIRSTLGLSYGIYSQYGLTTDYGIFYVFAQTKGPSTQKVLAEIEGILQDVAMGDSLQQNELDMRKQSLVNSLYSEYEPRFNFVKDEARFAYFGYPANYLELFRKKIEKVTLKQVRRVAQKYLRPDQLKILIVGDPEKIGKIPNIEALEIEGS